MESQMQRQVLVPLTIVAWLSASEAVDAHRIRWGEDAPQSVVEAVSTIRRALIDDNSNYCFDYGASVTGKDVSTRGIEIMCSNGQVRAFNFQTHARPGHRHSWGGWGIFVGGSELRGVGGDDSLDRFLAAWHFLAVPPPPRDPSTDASFLQSLQQSNAPVDAEAARRVQLQAEALLEAQQAESAALAYHAALRSMPAWAIGHYNLALVSARLEYYADAITAMRRYLYLAPNAENARPAQDMIYQWEGLLAAQ
jgi:tetratricopeptide (TPR) repeat protein